jgi:hypothetical protein
MESESSIVTLKAKCEERTGVQNVITEFQPQQISGSSALAALIQLLPTEQLSISQLHNLRFILKK